MQLHSRYAAIRRPDVMKAQVRAVENPFEGAQTALHALTRQLRSPETLAMTHAEVEALIEHNGREVLRQLLQGYIDLRGLGDVGAAVVGADGKRRTHKHLSSRRLESIFGEVVVTRLGYGSRGAESLFPLDAALNLPPELYSHGVHRRIAVAAARASYNEAVGDLSETTGATVPKRQAEQLAARAAADFDDFYAEREARAAAEVEATGDILVLTVDGKGVVMRKQDLRAATRQAAAGRKRKLSKRLSKGEKRNAKRMATVAAVYTIAALSRTAEDIVGELGREPATGRKPRPRPEHKRVWASIEKPVEEVIEAMFEEGLRRDPERRKTWVALVDGNKTQIRLLRRCARQRGITLVVVLDVIHVIEYLWRAARVFHDEASREAEQWVHERLVRILQGQSSAVAGGIRRSATKRGIPVEQRKPADTCAQYLLNYRGCLRYDTYLEHGFPIATGVIEGACRHLVKDRMDITGARWSLRGAEAVLRLRSLRASGDFDAYWRFHEERERLSNHDVNYDGCVAPALGRPEPGRARLRLTVIQGGG